MKKLSKRELIEREGNEAIKFATIILIGLVFIVGIGNGAFSRANSCYGAYLDMRMPIHYIFFPHTIGYYVGRALTHSIGSNDGSQCSTIFNKTLRGFN